MKNSKQKLCTFLDIFVDNLKVQCFCRRQGHELEFFLLTGIIIISLLRLEFVLLSSSLEFDYSLNVTTLDLILFMFIFT